MINDSRLIFEAYRVVNEQQKELLSPAFAQEYGGGGIPQNVAQQGQMQYGYLFGNTPEQADTFVNNVLNILKQGPDAVLKRIQPIVGKSTQSGRGLDTSADITFHYYFPGSPDEFESKVAAAIRQQLIAENRPVGERDIRLKYATRRFLSFVLKARVIPELQGEQVVFIDGQNVPGGGQIINAPAPAANLPPVPVAALTDPDQRVEPVAVSTAAPTIADEPKFNLSNTYELESTDDVRVPVEIDDIYRSVVRYVGVGVPVTGSVLVNSLREVVGSYTDAKKIAAQLLSAGVLIKKDIEPEIPANFDPFSEIEDNAEYDIDDILSRIERENAGGKTTSPDVED